MREARKIRKCQSCGNNKPRQFKSRINYPFGKGGKHPKAVMRIVCKMCGEMVKEVKNE